MIRPIKKMCSVMLAVSLVWTAVSVPASANTQENENDSKWHVTDDIATFVEPKYDDECCIWGEDEIAFVENGEWSEEANSETNIVFVDRDGIRTTISNDKGNGEQLFDEVYPMISEYGLSVMRLKKADKVAFINFKGEFLGGKNMFYTEAHPITENLLRVTDDGVSYKIINKNGEVTLDNIKNIKEGWWSIIELNSIYIFCEDSCYVLDKDGNLLKEFGEEFEIYDWVEDYEVIYRVSDGSKLIIDTAGNTVMELDDSYWNVIVNWANNYLEYMQTIEEDGEYVDKYFIMDVLNSKILSETYSEPDTDGNLILGEIEKDKYSLYDTKGNIYIDNVYDYAEELVLKEGFICTAKSWLMEENRFIVSLLDENDEAVTYVHTWNEDGSECVINRFEGEYMAMYSDYFVTKDANGYLKNMYTLDGNLVKKFAQNYYDEMYKLGIGNILFKVYDGNGSAYVTSTGEISRNYDWISSGKKLIFAYDYDGTTYVINSKNEIIREEKDGWCGDVSSENFTAYIVEGYSDKKTCIYGENGDLLFSGNNMYTMDYDSDLVLLVHYGDDYVNYGTIRVSDHISIGDAEIKLSNDKYTYNGSAIIPEIESVDIDGVTLKEGKDYTVSFKNNIKVGKATVIITGKGDYTGTCSTTFDIVYGTGMYKGTDGKWYYYVNGKVDTSYIGLAKNAYGWWYMNKGKLDTSYTGLVKYKTNWVYVSSGKLDSSYTGLVKYKSNWVYVKKGKLDATYTGLVKYKSNWVYVNKGKLDASYTGLVKYKSNWVYVNKGKLDTSFTGMAKNPYGWWYVTKGKLDLTYTGIAKNAYGTWYLQKGKLDLTFSGKVTVNGVKYTIKNGKVK